jgi:hypothetical protein
MLTVVERFQNQRLPRAQAIKTKVDGGALLSDEDMAFLKRVLEDAQYIKPYVDKHPEWQSLASRAMSLYKEIMDKALENEKASAGQP